MWAMLVVGLVTLVWPLWSIVAELRSIRRSFDKHRKWCEEDTQ